MSKGVGRVYDISIAVIVLTLLAIHTSRWHVKACKSLCEIKFLIDGIKKIKEKEHEKDLTRQDLLYDKK